MQVLLYPSSLIRPHAPLRKIENELACASFRQALRHVTTPLCSLNPDRGTRSCGSPWKSWKRSLPCSDVSGDQRFSRSAAGAGRSPVVGHPPIDCFGVQLTRHSVLQSDQPRTLSISKENSVVARQTIFHPFFWRAGAREQALDDSHWGTLMVSPAPPRPAPPRPAPGSGSNRQCAKAKLTFFPRECVCINIVYGSPTSRILSNSIVDILRVLPRRLRKNFCPRGLRGGPCDPAWVQPPQSVNSFCEKAWKVITT